MNIEEFKNIDDLNFNYKIELYEDIVVSSGAWNSKYKFIRFFFGFCYSAVCICGLITFVSMAMFKNFGIFELTTIIATVFFIAYCLLLEGTVQRKMEFYFFNDYLVINANPLPSGATPSGFDNLGTIYKLSYNNAKIEYKKWKKAYCQVDFVIAGNYEVLDYKYKKGEMVEIETGTDKFRFFVADYYGETEIKDVFEKYTSIEEVDNIEDIIGEHAL